MNQANYLALCPNHSAMYQHANGSSERMKDMFIDLETNELDVVLAQMDTTIYFTKTHIADLKTVIRVDNDVLTVISASGTNGVEG